MKRHNKYMNLLKSKMIWERSKMKIFMQDPFPPPYRTITDSYHRSNHVDNRITQSNRVVNRIPRRDRLFCHLYYTHKTIYLQIEYLVVSTLGTYSVIDCFLILSKTLRKYRSFYRHDFHWRALTQAKYVTMAEYMEKRITRFTWHMLKRMSAQVSNAQALTVAL